MITMKKRRSEEPKTKNTRKNSIIIVNLLIRLSFMGGLGINFFKSEWSYA